MSFLISDAIAQTAPAAQQPGIEGMLFPLGILIFFYFLFIRPQSKRNKEQKQMLAALGKGSEVVTSGGILGKVVDLDDNFVKLEVSDNTFIQVQRHAVATMMPKGTYKTLNKKA
ncbi:preprotein translocase subunit YajC [Methylomonas sp. MED-D]|uniref:Sec translocon accessory complex subunit YajC n=1 Tax=Methylomonas koyamae TaxID=702114 RepID=A0A177NYY1_9GAMM|nr:MULTISPECIES: preprotein translocase subunit YajC [Methylomonas]NJA06869.1 preprotein translocase subunit YajC [Methylococcaceae bacterium WWC4]MDT4328776.1 preprotein translocase subunit YajC [Methylomonas sp. MV1]OAI23256.1 preprotein translocase subunit YajC [Methylomonas koyamae]OHX35071.1 preprotein translocase subunit YajC [Methylomonas sp. LWB]WGS88012.1 preprotein translocase subunit YajC [Methylomonas sp. UP202]